VSPLQPVRQHRLTLSLAPARKRPLPRRAEPRPRRATNPRRDPRPWTRRPGAAVGASAGRAAADAAVSAIGSRPQTSGASTGAAATSIADSGRKRQPWVRRGVCAGGNGHAPSIFLHRSATPARPDLTHPTGSFRASQLRRRGKRASTRSSPITLHSSCGHFRCPLFCRPIVKHSRVHDIH
jgi:hypothetical protein